MINKLIVAGLLTFFSLKGNAQNYGEFKNIGSQIHSTTLQGSAFVTEKGKSYLYTVVRGSPAHLVGVDLSTNKTVVDLVLAKTDGSWGITKSTDGFIYVSTAKGTILKHRPGTADIENLGIALKGETVIWDVVAGRDGEIYGGTYPGCKVFRYHPKDGFKEISDGPVLEGQQYARYLAYDHMSHKLYVGVRIGISVHELDLNTGQKRMILSEGQLKSTSFYNLKLVQGPTGTQLLVGLSDSNKKRSTLVYDTKTSKIVDTIGAMDVRFLVENDGEIYFPLNDYFYKSKLNAYTRELKTVSEVGEEVRASALIDHKKIQWLTEKGTLFTYDLKTSKVQKLQLDLPQLPIDIQSVLFGPDKRIWTSGYLAGGNAAYNPVTGKTIEYKGLIQSEGMSKQGNSIYFGVYPSAKLYRYDINKTWDITKNNPKLIKQVGGESRPFAILSVESKEKMYFGTIPEYGRLGGTITEYDVKTHKVATYKGVVHNQSPTSLVFKDEVIWGGTTISGGLGIKATEKEAKLFSWDIVNKKTTYETVPIKGAMAITTLINGPDNNLWGIADGWLFIFDVASKSVKHQQQIYEVPTNRTHSWRDAFLIIHPSGKVYGSGGQNLFVIDPKTMKSEIIREKLGLLTMDDEGTLYLKNGADLWSFKPNNN